MSSPIQVFPPQKATKKDYYGTGAILIVVVMAIVAVLVQSGVHTV